MSKSKSTWATAGFWLPGLVVAICAAIATAHGLFEVVVASGVFASIAWTYPVITDGLAIVAYVATSRLTGAGRRYAWAVVILAAGLSGLAQAVYFVGGFTAPVPPGPNGEPGSAGNPPPELLRFWVGAWPAVAAAIVAHLLFMLSELRSGRKSSSESTKASGIKPPAVAETARPLPVQAKPVQSAASPGPLVQPPSVQSGLVQPTPLDKPATPAGTERPVDQPESVQPPHGASPIDEEPKPERPAVTPSSPKRDRALHEARKYQARHGSLPTVDQLHEAAHVSRGTAGTVLKELREQPHHLHVITNLNATKANS
ncbi:hypothetical protein [Amycolatopsis regifaucium]|uniref:DUF2637 domain-containing protein n=1 Tax=Amycolatopsis regifaucium TaxID=546365 RepID=A0A154MF11_9PSEU|nr:hypothetical protein [Amycolatopsis regifaucium]KZB82793.1 hypothetical protein AVL48_37470 [Amycolatopsis regifaucium]OKA03372.1 hypothetical protein ATP06_0236825 [Amycolatopsis regifaucium]SFJ75046.1 hypothetical protein SAMN04489731_1393 [Amycolatopsis regifaucium]